MTPYDLNLFEDQPDPARARRIVAPLDPSEYNVDPLSYL
jgi:hypothetical protein